MNKYHTQPRVRRNDLGELETIRVEEPPIIVRSFMGKRNNVNHTKRKNALAKRAGFSNWLQYAAYLLVQRRAAILKAQEEQKGVA